jgi:oxygen-independent coproporphyrinogen-3 oxidase
VGQGSIGLYIHAPFCRSKCVYCDFNSIAGRGDLVQAYVGAMGRSLANPTYARDLGVETIYFGGGNPALLGSGLVEILDLCRERWLIADDAEISLEMNPEDVEEQFLRELRAAGFNRLSLGWQTLDDDKLKLLGRRHDAATAINALAIARRAGFENVNIDLISGLPGQALSDWEKELSRAVESGPEHISAYSLSVEPGTPLATMMADGGSAAAAPPLPSEDEAADMFLRTRQILCAAGYEHYEISNYSRPGHRCRHNMNYWFGGNYLGFGAGAHSHMDGCRWWNTADPAEFIRDPEAAAGMEKLDPGDRVGERVFLGLRLVDGIESGSLEREFGVDLGQLYGESLKRLRRSGLMVPGPRLALTEAGLPLANEVMACFV